MWESIREAELHQQRCPQNQKQPSDHQFFLSYFVRRDVISEKQKNNRKRNEDVSEVTHEWENWPKAESQVPFMTKMFSFFLSFKFLALTLSLWATSSQAGLGLTFDWFSLKEFKGADPCEALGWRQSRKLRGAVTVKKKHLKVNRLLSHYVAILGFCQYSSFM